MADTIQKVQVEALAIMKIIKHARESYPTVATGSLVGMDVAGGTLEVTNCFPFPTLDSSATDPTSSNSQSDNYASAQAAAAAPRAKTNNAYQAEMIKLLREVNIDANNVGWYTSVSMGNFVNLNTIENQFFYQKEMNGERTIALVYDGSRSAQGSLAVRAYKLSAGFMTAFKEGKFTVESLQKSQLRYSDILVEIPIQIHNSHILTTLLHQLPTAIPSSPPEPPSSLGQLKSSTFASSTFPLAPNLDSLDLSIDPFLEKTCDLLLESVEAHHTELNNHQYYARSLAREQAKIAAWQAKRKAENATRVATKQPLLPEDEYLRLFKLPTEPSRLEIMLNSRQVEQYSRQVDGFTGAVSSKMFAVKSNLLPGEG